jgi:hypothetical protein
VANKAHCVQDVTGQEEIITDATPKKQTIKVIRKQNRLKKVTGPQLTV